MYFPAQHKGSGEITFYMKGADAAMTSIVHYSDWLDEEVNLCCDVTYRNLTYLPRTQCAFLADNFEI